MTDMISAVAAWLEEMGISYATEDDALRFDLPFGSTSYDCAIWPEGGDSIVVSAVWYGSVPVNRITEAQQLLAQFVALGDGAGQTMLNSRTGQVMRQASVDVSMIQFNAQAVKRIIDEVMDPFNVKVLALGLVLERRMKAHEAAETYEEWERARTKERAAQIRRALGHDEIDPTLN